MSLAPHNAANIDAFRVHVSGEDRRRTPRFEALGPGEIRSTSGESLGSVRLVDESEGGMACTSGAQVEVGQVVSVRIGGAAQVWRPAVVISTLACGSFRRLGLMYQSPRAIRCAA